MFEVTLTCIRIAIAREPTAFSAAWLFCWP